MPFRISELSVLLLALLVLNGQALAQPGFVSTTVASNGWVRLAGKGAPERILTLEGSSDLLSWNPLGVLCTEPNFGEQTNTFQFLDFTAPSLNRRFYRLAATQPQPTNDWRNQVTVVSDPLLSQPDQGGSGSMLWVKFMLLRDEPNRVFYQDSAKYLFHYDFAKERLAVFEGMTAEAFNAVTLRTNHQQAVLGAVLVPAAWDTPTTYPPEYGIQFTGLDPYPPELVVRWFELVRSTVVAPLGVKALYLPTFEQTPAALANEDFYRTNGILVGSVERWSTGNQVYSPGWALGRLKFFAGVQVASAYAEGLLLPGDILLTDGVPVEMPALAGILTLTPATPNSHVAILASSYAIPFAYLANTNDAAQALALQGREVLLQATRSEYASSLRFTEIGSTLDAKTRADILALKAQPVNMQPKQRYGAYSASADALTPADVRFFGGKAANFGFLRRAIPSNSPPAIAFSFDLWDDFMAQPLPGGKTLRAQITETLARYTNFPPNRVALESDLAAIRDLITKAAVFTSAQQQAITNALRLFDPTRNLRFRSSSNAEDNQVFTAAGLYDSYSGCLADDLDGDANGPCFCDSAEPKERGVFRAIQKVYASFYNPNGFSERLRHGIDESQVGMALLVHHSVPDEQEIANGVATLTVHRFWSGNGYAYQVTGDLVTQVGAVSVTNPRTNAQPERVYISDYSYGASLDIRGRSSLVPLGGFVLVWQEEYVRLYSLLSKVIKSYAAQFPDKVDFVLDFEYKKNVPGELQVKQVRELPSHQYETVRPFLIGGATDYRVLQGEGWGSLMTRHRLKSRLTLQSSTLQLTDAVLKSGYYRDVGFEFVDGTSITNWFGGFTNWPGYTHSVTNNGTSSFELTDSWTFGGGTNLRTWKLTCSVPRERSVLDPFVADGDLQKTLTVTYSQPFLDSLNPTEKIVSETVLLTRYTTASGAVLSTNYATLDGRVPPPGPGTKSVTVGHYLYEHPGGLPPIDPGTIIKTLPLDFFDEIRIAGLISEPIVLRSYYAQSAVPAHHNWGAWYMFEPRLDPETPQRQLDELVAANIRLVYVTVPPPWEEGIIYQILGYDGKLRAW